MRTSGDSRNVAHQVLAEYLDGGEPAARTQPAQHACAACPFKFEIRWSIATRSTHLQCLPPALCSHVHSPLYRHRSAVSADAMFLFSLLHTKHASYTLTTWPLGIPARNDGHFSEPNDHGPCMALDCAHHAQACVRHKLRRPVSDMRVKASHNGVAA